MKFTYHAREERLERLAFIGATVGFGKPIKEDVFNGTRHQLTDTGVILVKSLDRQTLITAFIASERRVAAMYHGSVPSHIRKIVIKNRLYNDLSEFC